MSKSNRAPKILEDVTPVVIAPVTPTIPVDDKGRKTMILMSMEELGAKGIKNTSQAIRYLIGENYAPSTVAKFLGKRYQHVNNVSKQTLKRPVAQVVLPVSLGEVPEIEVAE